jgi:hypothetical protein
MIISLKKEKNISKYIETIRLCPDINLYYRGELDNGDLLMPRLILAKSIMMKRYGVLHGKKKLTSLLLIST